MRKWIWFSFWALFLLAVELAASPRVALGGVSPDWLLILMIFVALRSPAPEGFIAAWTLGMLADLAVGTRLGLFALGYMMVAAVLAQIQLGRGRTRVFVQAAVIFIAAVAAHTILAVAALTDESRSPGQCVVLVPTIALYTALVGPPLFWLLSRTSALLRIEPGGG